jgi:hypothetical protein
MARTSVDFPPPLGPVITVSRPGLEVEDMARSGVAEE